jgi:hypothetical protein
VPEGWLDDKSRVLFSTVKPGGIFIKMLQSAGACI